MTILLNGNHYFGFSLHLNRITENFFSFHTDNAFVGFNKEVEPSKNALFQTHLYWHGHIWPCVELRGKILTKGDFSHNPSVL